MKISVYGKDNNWEAKRGEVFYVSEEVLNDNKESLEIIDDNIKNGRKSNLLAGIAIGISIVTFVFGLVINNNTSKVEKTVEILQTDLSSINLTGDIQPNGNIMPNFVGQIYVQNTEDKEYGPASYIATELSKDGRKIISIIDRYYGGNSLIPQVSGYYKN